MISRVNYMDLSLTDEKILEIFSKISAERLIFFDIETTGLSWKNAMVFLIGVLYKRDGRWQMEQWFLDDPSAEKELLVRSCSALAEGTCLIHYNGKQFDLPFLKGRCQALDVPCAWEACSQMDLYQILRPYQKLFGLEHLRLADLEGYLGFPRSSELSGRKCASVYRKYVLEKQPAQAGLLFDHNREDLTGLLHGIRALAYPALFSGHFHLEACQMVEDTLSCTLRPDIPLPKPFSLDCHPRPWVISGSGQQVRADFALENGRLKMYHPDHKDHYYLPKEDMAVHKSVGAYVDQAHRVQATALTCYTWFPCSLEFMRDLERVEVYVRHCLALHP